MCNIGSHTPFYTLVTAVTSTRTPAIESALKGLLVHLLSRSILFQEDPHEADTWIRALPSRKPIYANLPAHLLANTELYLQDEAQGVAVFFDDCVQRCLKTPYRYVEAARSIISTTLSNRDITIQDDIESYPSPLIMTMLEQLEAKINNQTLMPSHIVGVVTYLRKVLFLLVGKTNDLTHLKTISEKLKTATSNLKIDDRSGVSLSRRAVQKELNLLDDLLNFGSPSGDIEMENVDEDNIMNQWLNALEDTAGEYNYCARIYFLAFLRQFEI